MSMHDALARAREIADVSTNPADHRLVHALAGALHAEETRLGRQAFPLESGPTQDLPRWAEIKSPTDPGY